MTEATPHYLGHRQRLRERFRKDGGDGFHDYELLELLLTYAIPQKDVKPIAKALIARFGSVAGLFDASQEELERITELGPTSATLIRLIKVLGSLYLGDTLVSLDVLFSPQAVIDFARMKLAGLRYEAFMVIYLNTKNGVIGHEISHEGTVDHAIVYPRRLFESALRCHASGVILVHNHPSGHPDPSEEDKNLTRSMVESARALDIRIVDHLIVGKTGYFSFAENRLLPVTGRASSR